MARTMLAMLRFTIMAPLATTFRKVTLVQEESIVRLVDGSSMSMKVHGGAAGGGTGINEAFGRHKWAAAAGPPRQLHTVSHAVEPIVHADDGTVSGL